MGKLKFEIFNVTDNLWGLMRDNFKVDVEDKIFGFALKYRPSIGEG